MARLVALGVLGVVLLILGLVPCEFIIAHFSDGSYVLDGAARLGGLATGLLEFMLGFLFAGVVMRTNRSPAVR